MPQVVQGHKERWNTPAIRRREKGRKVTTLEFAMCAHVNMTEDDTCIQLHKWGIFLCSVHPQIP